MKRDKKDTEFATDMPTKQQTKIKKTNERGGYTETPRPHNEEDLIMDEKKGKSTSL